jgi:S-adenosylmethionine-diacylglycerol 3-amino-3-carboxypropyl transferase
MPKFFSRLSYSFGNEDWNTEKKALAIKPDDRVVCITASGDRPLHILTQDCAHVTAVDANKIQNHLLHLKAAAMQRFDFDHYLSFLGATEDHHRLHSLQVLVREMSHETAQFWNTNRHLVTKGVLYQGATEQLLTRFSPVLHMFRPQKIKRLFAISHLEEQKKFIQHEWDTYFWRKSFDFALNPFLSKIVLSDPGLYSNIGTTIKAGSYIYNRMNDSLSRYLAQENHLISLMFNGKVGSKAFPPYLQEAYVRDIKSRLDRLSVETSDIGTFLENSPKNSFDCYSLSDVASYLSHSEFLRMLRGVRHSARPGARVSIRQFLSSHKLPEDFNDWFERDHQLEKELEKDDRCFVYRYLTGRVK